MIHFKTFGIYLILAFVLNSAKCSDDATSDSNIKVIIIRNLESHSNDLDIDELHQLDKKQLTNDSTQLSNLTYAAGKRIEGDQLVASISQSYSWNTSGDRRLVITYPRAGQGALITYILINVEQSTPYGRAAITKGGLGFRYTEFYIDAYQTNYLNYSVEIYGFY